MINPCYSKDLIHIHFLGVIFSIPSSTLFTVFGDVFNRWFWCWVHLQGEFRIIKVSFIFMFVCFLFCVVLFSFVSFVLFRLFVVVVVCFNDFRSKKQILDCREEVIRCHNTGFEKWAFNIWEFFLPAKNKIVFRSYMAKIIELKKTVKCTNFQGHVIIWFSEINNFYYALNPLQWRSESKNI